MRNINFRVSVIIPVLNEQDSISLLVEKVVKVLESGSGSYEIIVIDDGSTDDTLSLIKKLRDDNDNIKYISFSRNFGHQNAIRAGLKYTTGDCVISMDGDMQHPPGLIPELIGKWKEGFDIVYTIRRDEPDTPFLKKLTSGLFYKLMNLISDINFKQGEADFRLLDKFAVIELNNLNENAIFYRGMVKWIGLNQIGIEYTPEKRLYGETRYSGKKMGALALSGITGFSTKPLRISTIVGISIAFLSLIYGIYAIYIKLFTERSIEGWTSVFFMVTLIGGIQLIMIGILGEYIGRIFIESKKRPNYIVREDSFDGRK